MNRYQIIQDINFFGKIVAKKSDILSPNDRGMYLLMDNEMSESAISNDPNFKLMEKIEVNITEVSDNELDTVKTWRLQLDVTTSKRKLMEIESEIRDKISEILIS